MGEKISVLWYFCMRLLYIPSDPKGGMNRRIARHEKGLQYFLQAGTWNKWDTQYSSLLKNHTFRVRILNLLKALSFCCVKPLKRLLFWKIWFVTHFAFLTFEVGDWAKPNSTLLEPVKVDEMADCPRSYSKLIGQKRWSFCKKNKKKNSSPYFLVPNKPTLPLTHTQPSARPYGSS